MKTILEKRTKETCDKLTNGGGGGIKEEEVQITCTAIDGEVVIIRKIKQRRLIHICFVTTVNK